MCLDPFTRLLGRAVGLCRGFSSAAPWVFSRSGGHGLFDPDPCALLVPDSGFDEEIEQLVANFGFLGRIAAKRNHIRCGAKRRERGHLFFTEDTDFPCVHDFFLSSRTVTATEVTVGSGCV